MSNANTATAEATDQEQTDTRNLLILSTCVIHSLLAVLEAERIEVDTINVTLGPTQSIDVSPDLLLMVCRDHLGITGGVTVLAEKTEAEEHTTLQ
jgi:hypothetical protein